MSPHCSPGKTACVVPNFILVFFHEQRTGLQTADMSQERGLLSSHTLYRTTDVSGPGINHFTGGAHELTIWKAAIKIELKLCHKQMR